MKTKKLKSMVVGEFEIKFWKDWLYADMLKRLAMVEKLPIVRDVKRFGKLPKKMRKHIFAQMLNGYFEDLESAVYTKTDIEKRRAKK